MLNRNKVLNYVKDNLAFPFMHLELDDDKILEYITEYTLNTFSEYVRYKKKMYLDLTSDKNKVPEIQNEYYIHDDEGLEIINVSQLYPNESDYYVHGHPPLGPMTYGEIPSWALATTSSMDTKMFSSFDKTWEFIHPNIIRISPVVGTSSRGVTIEYETVQPSDFSGIPNQLQTFFCRLALADIKIVIGRIRKRYGDGTLATPFGEIPLSSDIFDEGKEERREVIEKLEEQFIPDVIFDKG